MPTRLLLFESQSCIQFEFSMLTTRKLELIVLPREWTSSFHSKNTAHPPTRPPTNLIPSYSIPLTISAVVSDSPVELSRRIAADIRTSCSDAWRTLRNDFPARCLNLTSANVCPANGLCTRVYSSCVCKGMTNEKPKSTTCSGICCRASAGILQFDELPSSHKGKSIARDSTQLP